MKTNLALIIITLLCISCTKNENLYQETKIEIDPNLYLTKELAVPIMDGKITVVTSGNDTLAVADIPVTIEVPKEATIASRAGNNININYVDYKELPKFTKGSYITEERGIFMFEDTEKADYDYNEVHPINA